jgi:hypothetical protein
MADAVQTNVINFMAALNKAVKDLAEKTGIMLDDYSGDKYGDVQDEKNKEREDRSKQSKLTSPETSRYREIFKIFADVTKLPQNLSKIASIIEKQYIDQQKKVEQIDSKPPTTKDKSKESGAITRSESDSKKISGSGLGNLFSIDGLIAIGGLLSTLAAFGTNGKFKGALEVIGKIGLKGGTSILKNATSVLFKLFGAFDGGIIKSLVKTGLKSEALKPILKVLGSIVKRLAKRIPIIGSIIGIGFAIQRFKNGDTVGGTIEVLSALAGLLDLAVPGLGFTLSLGLDLLNAYLDYKAGGSNATASAKKMDILKDIGKKLGDAAKGILSSIKDGFNYVIDFIKKIDWSSVWNSVKDVFKGIWEFIKEIDWAGLWGDVTDVFDGIWKFIEEIDWAGLWSGLWGGVKDMFKGIWEFIKEIDWAGLWGDVTDVFDGIWKFIEEINWAGIWSNIKGAFKTVIDTVANIFKNIGNIILNFFKGDKFNEIMNEISPIANSVIDSISNAFKEISKIVGKVIGWFKDYISEIPKKLGAAWEAAKKFVKGDKQSDQTSSAKPGTAQVSQPNITIESPTLVKVAEIAKVQLAIMGNQLTQLQSNGIKLDKIAEYLQYLPRQINVNDNSSSFDASKYENAYDSGNSLTKKRYLDALNLIGANVRSPFNGVIA